MKVFCAQVNPVIGDVEGNVAKVLNALFKARKAGASIVLFPELVLSGYFPDDLLLDKTFIDAIFAHLPAIQAATQGLFAVVGLPRKNGAGGEKPLYNSAAIFADGELLGFQDKTLLPTYDVFDERRFFEPGNRWKVWEYQGQKIAVTICEDAWQHARQVGFTDYTIDPILKYKEQKPMLMLNLSGSPYSYRRLQTREAVFAKTAQTLQCPVVFCNQVGANDSLLFDGYSFCLNGRGEAVAHAKGFIEQDLVVDLAHLPKLQPLPDQATQDLYDALVMGVRDYFHKQGFKKAILGLSGGIDSALVACIAKEALGAGAVQGLSLPTRFSSKGSVTDAKELAHRLGIEWKKVEIEPIFQNYLQLLGPFFHGSVKGETEENLQARIRGMVLMAFSNQSGALLLNTSNKSETAMGYTTLYGDMAGGLGVLQDVTKLRVYELARYINRKEEVIPRAILEKVPSAELRENQTDLDTLPPFEVLDAVIEDAVEEGLAVDQIAKKRQLELSFVQELVRKIYQAEYKRRQAPIGLRVTQKAFSKGRVIPIVHKWVGLNM